MEHFYSVLLEELAENCDFETREEAIIQDTFITNMLDDNIQRELLRDRVRPERALGIAVEMELGNQNRQKVSSNNSNGVNVIQQFNRFRGANARVNETNRTTFNRESTGL